MLKIATIVGSLRKESINKKLLQALDKLSHPDLTFNIINIADIPLYNQDNENNLPPAVVNLKTEVINSDGVLIVTPEYNRSIPGVLKNVLDWGSRPYGQSCWKNKPTGMIGTSPGVIGTAVAQSHLRSVMLALNTIVLGLPEVYLAYKDGLIDEKGQLTDENTKKFLQGFLDNFSRWVRQHQDAGRAA